MKQRINLARGLCVGSEVMLLDEPFAALDEQTRMVLGEDLSILLARRGKTIVFVTHSLAEAVFLADRIIVMTARPGKVKASIVVPEPHPRSPDFMLTDVSRRSARSSTACCATKSGRPSPRCASRATRRREVMMGQSIISGVPAGACVCALPLEGEGSESPQMNRVRGSS